MKARRHRGSYDESDHFVSIEEQGKKTIDTKLDQFATDDWFSRFTFSERHAFPGVARQKTFASFDRWLGGTID